MCIGDLKTPHLSHSSKKSRRAAPGVPSKVRLVVLFIQVIEDEISNLRRAAVSWEWGSRL